MKKVVDGVVTDMTQDEIDEISAIQNEMAASIAREKRDIRLVTEVDPIAGNALRWASLTAEQQQVWAGYRQALLDVPSQSGFPHDIVWPNKPE